MANEWTAERVLEALRAGRADTCIGRVNEVFGAGSPGARAYDHADTGGARHDLPGASWVSDVELKAMATALNRAQASAAPADTAPERCWHEATKDGTARCELPAGHAPTDGRYSGRHVTRDGDVVWYDASGCSGGTMGFHRCRCARCLYERGEGPKPPPVLPGVEFATAKAGPAPKACRKCGGATESDGAFGVELAVCRACGHESEVAAPSAEYAAECRACPACPDGICSRHHPDDREAALGAHPEPAGMTALGVALTRSWAEHADPAPKAAPVDPYEAHAVGRLNQARDAVYGTFGETKAPRVPGLEATARQALSDLKSARLSAEKLAAAVVELEAAIAEHGRKAGGA